MTVEQLEAKLREVIDEDPELNTLPEEEFLAVVTSALNLLSCGYETRQSELDGEYDYEGFDDDDLDDEFDDEDDL